MAKEKETQPEEENESSSAEEEDYDYDGVLRLPTPRFTSKTFSYSGGDVSTSLEFFPFYGGGWGEGGVLCVDEDGKVTVELMSGLVLPKRGWHDAVSISVIHGAGTAHDPSHPNALYVMDSKGHSL